MYVQYQNKIKLPYMYASSRVYNGLTLDIIPCCIRRVNLFVYLLINLTYQVGRAVIKRAKRPIQVNSTLLLLHSQLPLLELLMYCVDMGHMSILVRYKGRF